MSTASQSIKANPSLTVFAAIVARSGDAQAVDAGPLVLVPTDDAFANAGITVASVPALSAAFCDSVVKYYTLPVAPVFSGSGNTEIAVTTGLGSPLYADSTGTGLYFNGAAQALAFPVVAGPCSYYTLSQFINPPAASLLQVVNSDTSLSLLAEALNRTNAAAALTSGNFTLFMPTNSAFAAAGFPDIASIDAADLNTLTQILLYHVVPNFSFANDLATLQSLPTAQGGNITVSTANGLHLVGNSDPAEPASLLNYGTIAGNILAYKINNVLLP